MRLRFVGKAVEPSQGPAKNLVNRRFAGWRDPQKRPQDKRCRPTIAPTAKPSNSDGDQFSENFFVMGPQSAEKQMPRLVRSLMLRQPGVYKRGPFFDGKVLQQ